ncbi:DNA mismatch repair endonuclease MutL [Geochorda subterranea]|uniref:DNA mismatch repair protein MutL n=1 Tax=Geochorda subterranea TaxID=3109564 RepID=A0ABZ1BKZ5_9FIRM|nr:DNA mismatch repair endonuclease MutL [Limnochorda sp. LNt]WRP13278.1 DNA mismatch repair endonuclease MutL [Limnochorda sp. LNt]
MGKIALLAEDVVDHIAAGEVVERPASALKELLENALDAGARRIRVDIGEDGTHLMVSDDGEGMDPDDAAICVLRHATSKLRRREDLASVATLGFRGEALAAIAAVSELEILTRPPGRAEGFRIRLAGGERLSAGPAAAPEGTTVWVRRLFFNTPARRRYLKSPAAERRACLETAARIALARPSVALEVAVAGQPRWVTPGDGDLRAAAGAVMGAREAQALLPVQGARGPARVWGLVSPPDLSRPTREHLWIFVNGRWVQDRTVSAAVVRAYESRLAKGRFPVAFLHLEMDPAWVDVNVHPAKLFVRFRDERLLFGLVASAVERALASAPTFALSPSVKPGDAPATKAWREGVAEGARSSRDPGAGVPVASEAQAPLWGAVRQGEGLGEQLRRLQVLGQLRDTYIVTRHPAGLLIVDQHVAHERMLYERLLAARRGSVAPAQALLHPLTVELGSTAAETLGAALPWLASLGVEMEPFGPRHYLVRSVPAVPGIARAISATEMAALLEELAARMLEGPEGMPAGDDTAPLAPWEERLLKHLACRSAVKAGTPLPLAVMEHLVRHLAETDNPYTCPHGRPVAVMVSVEELDRRFGRRTPLA